MPNNVDYKIDNNIINNNGINNTLNKNRSNGINNNNNNEFNNMILNNQNINNNLKNNQIGNNDNFLINQFNNMQINNNQNNNKNSKPNKCSINNESIIVIIQCLYNCKELRNHFSNKNECEKYLRFQNNVPLTSALANIIYKISNMDSKSFVSNQLKTIIETRYNYQSDKPKYILLYILNKIHEEIKVPVDLKNQNQLYTAIRKECYDYFYEKIFKPESTSIISNSFFGIKEKFTICQRCQNITYEYNIFTLLEFPIDEIVNKISEKLENCLYNEENKSFFRIMKNINKQKISIEDCFDYYINYCQENIYFICKHCFFSSNNNRYNNRLMYLPNMLCIVLNKTSESSLKVEFPETLDISKFLEKDFVEIKIYNLIGIIFYNNNNNKIAYFSCTKSKNNNQWYKIINDNYIQCNISDAIKSGFPYILFYQKQ